MQIPGIWSLGNGSNPPKVLERPLAAAVCTDLNRRAPCVPAVGPLACSRVSFLVHLFTLCSHVRSFIGLLIHSSIHTPNRPSIQPASHPSSQPASQQGRTGCLLWTRPMLGTRTTEMIPSPGPPSNQRLHTLENQHLIPLGPH